MKKRSIIKQVLDRLKKLCAFGDSKHADKKRTFGILPDQ